MGYDNFSICCGIVVNTIHINKLFDNGWISFINDGSLVTVYQDIDNLLKDWNKEFNGAFCEFNEKQKVITRLYIWFHNLEYKLNFCL